MSGTVSRLTLLVLFGAVATDRGADRQRYFVHAPAQLAAGAALAVEDLRRDLQKLTGEPVRRRGLPAGKCVAGEVHLLVLGHEHQTDGRRRVGPSEMDRQEYRIDEQRCRNGRRVVLSGGSLLAGQWAVYDLLQRLGVRYFHPEQTFYPGPADTAAHVNWPAEPLQVRARPGFARRSMHVHRDHPVELSAPKHADRAQMAALQRRWIDWNVKLRQTQIDGWDEEFVGNYAYVRGFPRTASLNLANAQQGGRPLLNADDPRTEKLQIGRAIDQALRPVPGLPPVESLSFQFNPSEFSETDEDLTVERLNKVASHIERHHPGVSLYTINHGTAQPPTAKRQVRFFDLSAFAPPRLGVMVHPLMFYDLERPAAGVYGNDDFGPLLAFIRAQQAVRPIVHYPEASWWLTFDLPVPLYLAPVTLEARQHDLQLLAPYRTAEHGARHGVMGHHLFTSGQEWGYWLIDYCVAQMVWDPALGHRGCVDDFTRQLARGTEIAAVLAEVEARQVRDLRDPERLRFLVGSDDETEAAAGLGIRFHPLPPPPADLLEWDEAAVSALRERSLRPLAAMAADYHTWANRVEGLLPLQSAAQAPWVREIRDGLRIFALRAEHAVAVYEGALVVREQRLAAAAASAAGGAGDADSTTPDRIKLGRALARARALTDAARQVVRRREIDYRYPAALTIAGGPRGTPDAQPNRTVYPYRYLTRTHHLDFWTRPDEQLADLVRQVLRDSGQSLASEGKRVLFPKGSVRVTAPSQAQRLEGLLPGLTATLGDDGAPFMELVPAGGADATAWRTQREGRRSGPSDLPLALRKLGDLVIRQALVEVDVGERPGRPARLTIRGHLRTEDIVSLMVKTGGFEPNGARLTLALTLGYTPSRLPDAVPLELRAEGRAL
jgi:hypothetical protein